jgi:hypothetical protein
MIFKIYDSDFGIKINGTTYDFDQVDDMTIDDPEMTRLVRGANGTNKEGLVYKEGIKEPKKVTVTILGMSSSLKSVLDGVFTDKTRVDVYCVSRSDGSSKIFKNAILSQQPQQLSVNDSPESMNIALAFESFDASEDHKS